MKLWLKRSIWVLIGIVVVFVLVRSFRETPVLVDVATISRGPLRVTVDDDGWTRVRERYTISAPIGGRLLRTALDPGDPVRAGETLVLEFAPVPPDLLDSRSLGEARARLRRADAAWKEAEARRAQEEIEVGYARSELERIGRLFEEGIQPRDTLDRAERDERRAAEGLRAAQLAAQVAMYELELARASLLEASPVLVPSDTVRPDEQGAAIDEGIPVEANVSAAVERSAPGGRLLLRSPIDGVVLRVLEESARTMAAGTPILEVGNTASLEIVADYLSQDAVRVRPGMEALVEGWGGQLPDGREKALRGRVRVVEPGGFTKVSALGVEEQRTNIIVDPGGDPAEWAALGDRYRVELRIVLWAEEDVLIAPTGSLFREDDTWSVFTVEEGRARRREVVLGRRNGLEAQVIEGLEEGETIILYPSELVADDTAIEAR